MEYESEVMELNYEGSVEIKNKENVALGIVGALVGALIGGASIFLFSKMGYVASLSGFILAFCTLKGYQILGKGMSAKGLIVCVALMLVTPFAADWIYWTSMVQEAFADFGIGFPEAMELLPELLAGEEELRGEYVKNLAMLYLFVVLGGLASVRDAVKGK